MNWQIAKFTGTPDQVKDKVSNDAKIPKHVKDFIAADIATLAKPTLITVAAYSQDTKGQDGETLRNIQITLKI